MPRNIMTARCRIPARVHVVTDRRCGDVVREPGVVEPWTGVRHRVRPPAGWAFPKAALVIRARVGCWQVRSVSHLLPLFADGRRAIRARSIAIGSSNVHWIETEPRGPGDRQHSLVFAQDGTLHLTAVVTKLLEVAVGRRGVWPEPAALPGFLAAGSISLAALWRHRNRKVVATEAADAEQAATVPVFSLAGALVAIRKAASG